jgi:hypothetical protein
MLNESDTGSLLPDTRALREGDPGAERPRSPRTLERLASPLVALLAIVGTLAMRPPPQEPTVGVPPASPEPAAPGVLDFDSVPQSHVLVDGHPLGTTPLTRERVSPGPHVIAFVYAPGVSCRQTIRVAPGTSSAVVDRLGAPSTPGRSCRGPENVR